MTCPECDMRSLLNTSNKNVLADDAACAVCTKKFHFSDHSGRKHMGAKTGCDACHFDRSVGAFSVATRTTLSQGREQEGPFGRANVAQEAPFGGRPSILQRIRESMNPFGASTSAKPWPVEHTETSTPYARGRTLEQIMEQSEDL